MRTIRLWLAVFASLLAACSSSGLQTAESPPPTGSQDQGSDTTGTNVADMCARVTTNDAGPIDACPCIRAGRDPSGTSCGNVWQTCFYDIPGCTISSCNCEAKDAGAQWVCLSRQC